MEFVVMGQIIATKITALALVIRSSFANTKKTVPNYSLTINRSECDPGWGLQWSKSSSCPLNVCCSEFGTYLLSKLPDYRLTKLILGYCGTTKDFCGDKTVKRPSCSSTDTKIDKVIGYYESWSTSERSCHTMKPDEIPYGYYTHLK